LVKSMKTLRIYSWKAWRIYPVQTAILKVGRIETVLGTGPSYRPPRPRHTDSTPHAKMKVTEKDVAYVADLANLELTEDERGGMLRDLNSILDYVDRLNQLDTTDVPPMAQVSDRYGVDKSRTGSARFIWASREDILEGLRKSLPHQVALENAPDTDGTFFKVPKVIER
jgi:aspartyl-tRNA(Asn)/glutamyl-tRNA(Gln) amidotransferase subunit C